MREKMQQAKEVYTHIQDKLKGQEGKIIAIELETGDYFVGTDTFEAYEKGRQKYPRKEFFFMRVGAKTAYVLSLPFNSTGISINL